MQFSFIINDTEYEVPETVTLEKFSQAMSWNPTVEANKPMFVSSLTSCPPHLISLLDDQTFEMIYLACVAATSVYGVELKTEIGTYRLKQFDELTFGQFIDMDLLISSGTIENAVQIASIIWQIPAHIVAQMDFKLLWESIILAFKWRQNLYKEYDEFFEVSEKNTEDEDEDRKPNLQLMWYEAVLALAEYKFLNIHKATDRPVKEALNFLVWKKSQAQKQQLENLKRKHELSRRR